MEYGCTEIAVAATAVSQPTALTSTDADGWHATFGSNRVASAGVRVTHRSVMGYPAFYRGVNLIANAVSDLPLDVFERNGDDRVIDDDHPAQKLIKRMASPVLRAKKCRKTLQAHALIFGNGFAHIERNALMEPMELWILDPQGVIVRYFEGELWYCTTINGKQVKFPGRDILHITGLTHDGIVGYSALDTMKDALGVGMAAQEFGGKFFGSGSNMSGLLMIPGNLKEEAIRNTIAAWNEMSSGLENSHKVALVQDGVKFQQMTVDPNKGQFNETREFEIRAVVANILGVPPHLLGDSTRTSHNSLESEEQSFLTHSLNPWLNEFEDECALKLLSAKEQDENTHFVEFNREAAVQMLFTEKIEGLYRQVEMGQLTINESRKLINLPGVGEDGDKRYHPANWAEVGAEPVPVAAPAAPVPAADDEDDENNEPPKDGSTTALKAMIQSSVQAAVRMEQRRVKSASEKPNTFLTSVDSYYEVWTKSNITGLVSADAAKVKQEHADESKRQVLDVAGSCGPATLTGNITALVDTWDDRVTTLTTNLMETIQ